MLCYMCLHISQISTNIIIMFMFLSAYCASYMFVRLRRALYFALSASSRLLVISLDVNFAVNVNTYPRHQFVTSHRKTSIDSVTVT